MFGGAQLGGQQRVAQGPQAASASCNKGPQGCPPSTGALCVRVSHSSEWLCVGLCFCDLAGICGVLQERGTTSPRPCSKGCEAGLWHLSWSCCCPSLQALQGGWWEQGCSAD